MELQCYLEIMRKIQVNLLKFIDDDENSEENYQNLIQLFNDQNIQENKQDIKSVLHLISAIAENHYRSSSFFSKIEKILKLFFEEIKKNFSNSEIFSIFEKNHRILLFLIQSNTLILDKEISFSLYSKYDQYFSPEISPFIDDEDIKTKISIKDEENFEKKRKIGENEMYICELIRKDMISEFIIYVNKENLALTTKIETSKYETNSFLMNFYEISLIEYAAFFGSIQIFKYLYLNQVKLTSSLWNFVIHSDNQELINILQEKRIEPDNCSYNECIEESIKCHHNDMANYILNSLDEDNLKSIENDEDIKQSTFNCFNYVFIPNEIKSKFIVFYLCSNDYFRILEILLKSKKININEKMILRKKI